MLGIGIDVWTGWIYQQIKWLTRLANISISMDICIQNNFRARIIRWFCRRLKSHFMGQFCIHTVSINFLNWPRYDYTRTWDLTKLNRSSFNGVSLNTGRNKLLYIFRRKRFGQLVFLISWIKIVCRGKISTETKR